jgi:hypothetical protein
MTPIQTMSGFMVFDNFLQDPLSLRQSALDAGFGTWRPNTGEVGSSKYDGMCFWGDHTTPLRRLAQTMGQPIYPGSMFFRVTNKDTEAAYVHSDREAGEYTAILYLSAHSDNTSGTGFYRNRRTGRTFMDGFAEMRGSADFETLKKEMVDGSSKYWEQIKFIPGDFNRLLVFHAPLFHSRIPKHGFGEKIEDGRMVWVAHFDT